MSSELRTAGIIPARFGSTRFPGKPLEEIGEKTMVQRVYEQAGKAGLDELVVATDDQRILSTVKRFGGNAVLTDGAHPSGTHRCAEALAMLKGNFDVVLNIQGDEPFLDPDHLRSLIECFKDPETDIATLVVKMESNEDRFKPERVKCVRDSKGFALYFSRAAIPHLRDEGEESSTGFYRHLGIYGYRSDVLKRIIELPEGMLERAEKLEQLRWMEAGYRIRTAEVDSAGLAVDTPADLEIARKAWADKSG